MTNLRQKLTTAAILAFPAIVAVVTTAPRVHL